MSERLGFRTIGYRAFAPEVAIRRIAAAGYDGVELCLEHRCRPEALSERRCAALAAVARDAAPPRHVSYHRDRDPAVALGAGAAGGRADPACGCGC